MKSRNDPPLHKSFPSPLSRSSLSCPPGFAIIIRTSPTVITDTLISTFTLTFIVFSVRLFFEFISIIILYVPLKKQVFEYNDFCYTHKKYLYINSFLLYYPPYFLQNISPIYYFDYFNLFF